MKKHFYFVLFLIVTACAAPMESPAPIATLTATTFSTETPSFTSTETPTSTQEPAATPEPTVIQTEITFDLVEGRGTLTIPAFMINKLSENAEERKEQEVLAIEKALQFMVKNGVAWGDMRTDRKANETTPEDIDFLKSFFYRKDKQHQIHIVGFTLPHDEVVDSNTFLVTITDGTNAQPGTIFIYRNDHEGSERRYNAVFIQIGAQTVVKLLENNEVRIPIKPFTP